MGKLVVGCLADTMGSVFSGWFYMSAEGWFFGPEKHTSLVVV